MYMYYETVQFVFKNVCFYLKFEDEVNYKNGHIADISKNQTTEMSKISESVTTYFQNLLHKNQVAVELAVF